MDDYLRSEPQFICTKCLPGRVDLKSGDDSQSLQCPSCHEIFPIINGIPRFVPKENYADSFGFQWNLHKKTQLDSYTKLPISEDRLRKIFDIDTPWTNQVVLEAGSGSGRFTEILSRLGCRLYTFDYSNAVDANKDNNGYRKNVSFFQGNIFEIPFPDKSFDKVICLGVIQHTPNPKKAFMKLAEKLKSGGTLAIDVYSRRLIDYFHWKWILRPLTKSLSIKSLYKASEMAVTALLPITMLLRKIVGPVATRISPIPDYSYLGLNYETNKSWSILDTFDIYSPKYDSPQTQREVESWFKEAGFKEFEVRRGINGIVGIGKK